jgi:hypothetical protein
LRLNSLVENKKDNQVISSNTTNNQPVKIIKDIEIRLDSYVIALEYIDIFSAEKYLAIDQTIFDQINNMTRTYRQGNNIDRNSGDSKIYVFAGEVKSLGDNSFEIIKINKLQLSPNNATPYYGGGGGPVKVGDSNAARTDTNNGSSYIDYPLLQANKVKLSTIRYGGLDTQGNSTLIDNFGNTYLIPQYINIPNNLDAVTFTGEITQRPDIGQNMFLALNGEFK